MTDGKTAYEAYQALRNWGDVALALRQRYKTVYAAGSTYARAHGLHLNAWKTEQARAMLEMRLEGYIWNDVGRAHGISGATARNRVRAYARKNGLPLPR